MVFRRKPIRNTLQCCFHATHNIFVNFPDYKKDLLIRLTKFNEIKICE